MFKGALATSGMPDESQEELLQNMRLMNEFGYYGGDSLNESHEVSPFVLTERIKMPDLVLARGRQADYVERLYGKVKGFC